MSFTTIFNCVLGDPFVPTAAIGVDMFPHTHHKEMVLLFERKTDDIELLEVKEDVNMKEVVVTQDTTEDISVGQTIKADIKANTQDVDVKMEEAQIALKTE